MIWVWLRRVSAVLLVVACFSLLTWTLAVGVALLVAAGALVGTRHHNRRARTSLRQERHSAIRTLERELEIELVTPEPEPEPAFGSADWYAEQTRREIEWHQRMAEMREQARKERLYTELTAGIPTNRRSSHERA